jgi:DNA-binding response OmpR family regulator
MSDGPVKPMETPQSATVLVIDDEPMVLSTLGRTLRQAGFQVITAPSGTEAVKVVRETRLAPDIALLDMTIADLASSQVVAELKRANRTVRILLISGYPPDDAAQGVFSAGVDGYLPKPFSPEILERRIREMLHQRRPEPTPQ